MRKGAGYKFFLLYLNPIINGVGNYYIGAQTRDARRTDVIVDYLEEYRLDRGYMISSNFNKNKRPGVREVLLGNRRLVETVV